MHTLNIFMKFDLKADPVLESGVKSFEINYFCTFRFIDLLFMALMKLSEFE